jgi:murein DD-endopeptidase MepM/ murein hydrolase activator NlpD
MVIAGGAAAGLTPLLAGRAGAAEAAPAAEDEGFDPALSGSTRDFGFLPPRPASEVYVRPMMFPVLPDATLGKATWSDTYLAPRSGGRLHEGQDLMGKKMLKLLAVVSGTIVELRHQSSGNSLYLKGDDGWYYCYLHINNDDPGTDNGANQFRYAFAPNLAIGSRVLKGDLIGFLGDSGNAEATAPHLHFEIRMPNAKWYNAAAVNAKYSLEKAEPAKVRAKVADSAFAPHANASAFVMAQVTDFLGGVAPAQPWGQRSVEDLEGGTVGLDPFIENMLALDGASKITAPTIRLYLGFFLRIPDFGGLDYWIRKVRSGTSLDTAASQFAGGSEFQRRYGSLTNADYVAQLYRNLFDREVDAGGLDYWVRRLDGGAKRGWLMRQLCESSEYRRKTNSAVRVIQVHAAMVRASPSADEYKRWSDWDAALPSGLQDLIETLRTGPAYTSRY